MKRKPPIPRLAGRIRKTPGLLDKECLARYGKPLTFIARDFFRFLRRFTRPDLIPTCHGGTGPESPGFEEIYEMEARRLMGSALICWKRKDGKPFREIAEIIEKGIPAAADAARAAIAEELIFLAIGFRPQYSSRELKQRAGDIGSNDVFRRKMKDIGYPFRKEPGKGGGRPKTSDPKRSK